MDHLPFSDYVRSMLLGQGTKHSLLSLMNIFPNTVNRAVDSYLKRSTKIQPNHQRFKIQPVSERASHRDYSAENQPSLPSVQIGFDCQFQFAFPPKIASNTATKTLPIHIDSKDKIFNCLFYLRHQEDNSSGGDLRLWRHKSPNSANWKSHRFSKENLHIDLEDCHLAKEIKYKRNRLVIMENSLSALHDISPRTISKDEFEQASSKSQNGVKFQYFRRMFNTNITLAEEFF